MELGELPVDRLEAMLAAGYEVRECRRVLVKAGLNIVGEILRGEGTFYEDRHYPQGDVFDADSHAQYYYHAHRAGSGEHGHFHTFVRAAGLPAAMQPLPGGGGEPLTHLVAISMDAHGEPTHLFTTNRWVTNESWYAADDVIGVLNRFAIDHAKPSWPTNRWIGAMLSLFHPQAAQLLRERDGAVAAWRLAHPEADAFEDRKLEITSIAPINVDRQIAAVEIALGLRAQSPGSGGLRQTLK